jgi:hypothetical protein
LMFNCIGKRAANARATLPEVQWNAKQTFDRNLCQAFGVKKFAPFRQNR